MNHNASVAMTHASIGIFTMLIFATLTWFGWTYLEIGVTFFPFLPLKWQVIGWWHCFGLTVVAFQSHWMLMKVRLLFVGIR